MQLETVKKHPSKNPITRKVGAVFLLGCFPQPHRYVYLFFGATINALLYAYFSVDINFQEVVLYKTE